MGNHVGGWMMMMIVNLFKVKLTRSQMAIALKSEISVFIILFIIIIHHATVFQQMMIFTHPTQTQ